MPAFTINQKISEQYHQIATQFGTPVYVYHEDLLEVNLNKLKSLFHGLPVNWLYAVKANDNPHLLKRIAAHGLGFDTVSFEEALLGTHFVKAAKIFYSENNMTDVEMAEAVSAGLRLNIGSESRLMKFAEKYPGAECSIRIKPDIGDGHHAKVVTGNLDSKFGIRLEILNEVIEAVKKFQVKITGIHTHIGSGIQHPENLLNAIKKMLEVAENFPDLNQINFGGGLPIPYLPDEKPFDLQEFERITFPMLEEFQKRHPNVQFWFEPGRFIMGNTGVLLADVNTVKFQGHKTYIGVNTGFNHLIRPVMYDAYHHIVNVTKWNQAETKLYEVAGNICESGDIFAHDRKLAQTDEGDLLAFMDAAAYGMTMASAYNRRAFPAEVLIKNDDSFQQIRERETPEQMVNELFQKTNFRE